MLHVIGAWCVARDLHMIVPGSLECACWSWFTAQWGDLELRLWMRLLSLLVYSTQHSEWTASTLCRNASWSAENFTRKWPYNILLSVDLTLRQGQGHWKWNGMQDVYDVRACALACVLFIGIVQHNWACLTWKSAIEIKLSLLLRGQECLAWYVPYERIWYKSLSQSSTLKFLPHATASRLSEWTDKNNWLQKSLYHSLDQKAHIHPSKKTKDHVRNPTHIYTCVTIKKLEISNKPAEEEDSSIDLGVLIFPHMVPFISEITRGFMETLPPNYRWMKQKEDRGWQEYEKKTEQ